MTSVLYLGGTGTISAACVRESLLLGHQVTVLNRGHSTLRPVPDGVEQLCADLDDADALAAALDGRTFDAVADFCSFTTARLAHNMELLDGRIGQYVFISSASAYAKPVPQLPITEATPLRNPYWAYSRDKIACEDLLTHRFRDDGFPMTIVRPSHTYDEANVPLEGGWTQIARMRAGKPAIVHGDGTSLWTLTHATDFAYCFARLLGRPQAIGHAYHITGDEVLTWDEIFTMLAHAAGVAEPRLVHLASETIAAAMPQIGPSLLGDKAHSVIFDNSAVRALAPGFVQRVPFSEGAQGIIAFHDTYPELQVTDAALNTGFDRLAAVA
ncbi:MAG: NAD-dependent epimerase/dehydratase family protein, partial [Propionibacteriaceae bacterium]|nr:NAD-dependent epimerase/dehydratase family protein [Propionibacteriaceae bacterium]